MVTVLIHRGGGNRVQWVNIHSGSGGSAQVPPLGGSFTLSGATQDRAQFYGGRAQK